MIGVRAWAAACALAGGIAARGAAQEVVPGGWAEAFGAESFGEMTPSGRLGAWGGANGLGMGGFASAEGGFGGVRRGIDAPAASASTPAPGVGPGWGRPGLTVNALDPLALTIGRATRRRRGR